MKEDLIGTNCSTTAIQTTKCEHHLMKESIISEPVARGQSEILTEQREVAHSNVAAQLNLMQNDRMPCEVCLKVEMSGIF